MPLKKRKIFSNKRHFLFGRIFYDYEWSIGMATEINPRIDVRMQFSVPDHRRYTT